MPIYEYQCREGHRFERMESFSAPVEQACARCGQPARRLLSLPAVIFKGRGFYSTENRKDGHRHEEGEAAKSGETAKGGETSTAPAAESTLDKSE